jgi:Mlc titration factor MtfA (ptsG expression regulator)
MHHPSRIANPQAARHTITRHCERVGPTWRGSAVALRHSIVSTAFVLHRRKGLPDNWANIVEEHVAVWRLLDDDERALLEATSDWLLRHKHWEAAQGLTLVDEITVTIAAQASLLVLGLTVDEYREVSAIIVYPTTMQSRGVYAGPATGTVTEGVVPVLGEAHERRGPVILAWDQADDAARHPGRGHNVVLHEFAHKLDMVDDILDGTPRLQQRGDRERWVAVCTEAYEALRAGIERPPLQPYGATNPAEFFAVATEAFFDVPIALEQREPALYEVMRDFYKQDPAARIR